MKYRSVNCSLSNKGMSIVIPFDDYTGAFQDREVLVEMRELTSNMLTFASTLKYSPQFCIGLLVQHRLGGYFHQITPPRSVKITRGSKTIECIQVEILQSRSAEMQGCFLCESNEPHQDTDAVYPVEEPPPAVPVEVAEVARSADSPPGESLPAAKKKGKKKSRAASQTTCQTTSSSSPSSSPPSPPSSSSATASIDAAPTPVVAPTVSAAPATTPSPTTTTTTATAATAAATSPADTPATTTTATTTSTATTTAASTATSTAATTAASAATASATTTAWRTIASTSKAAASKANVTTATTTAMKIASSTSSTPSTSSAPSASSTSSTSSGRPSYAAALLRGPRQPEPSAPKRSWGSDEDD